MPEVDLLGNIVIDDVGGRYRRTAGWFPHRTDLDQETAIFRQDAILRRQLLHRPILSLPEHSRLGPMPQEGHPLMTGREIGMCRLQVLHATVSSGLHAFPVHEKHPAGLHREGAMGEVAQRFPVKMGARPGKGLPRSRVETGIIQEARNCRVVIPQDNVSRERAQRAKDLPGPRTVPRNISQANRHVHAMACEIGHKGFPSRAVAIDI